MGRVGLRIFLIGFVGFMLLGSGFVVLLSQQPPKVVSVQLSDYDLQNARDIAAVKADIDSSKNILKGIGLLLLSLNTIAAGILRHVYKDWDEIQADKKLFKEAIGEFQKTRDLVASLDCVKGKGFNTYQQEV
jgi:hypothetical protein